MSLIRFSAPLQDIGIWTIVRVPKDASNQLPSRGQVMVQGAINGIQFRMPIEPDGEGSHWLHVDAELMSAMNANVGDAVSLEIEQTKEWPEPELPADWQAALDANPEIQALWQDVTPMARWEWLRWIESTKQPETRKKRIEVSCSKLSRGMRRPCCFNRNMCCVPDVSKNGVLINPVAG